MSNPIVDSSRLLARRSRSTCVGYDYGIPARALLAIDPSFINLLYEAKIVGCAYGIVNSRVTGEPMRAFYVVAQNGDAARQAFEVFRTWTEAMGADCVKLEVIVLTQGGYLLTIGPEPHRSGIRVAGYGSLFEPITMGYTYVKRMDTISAGLLDLRKYKSSPISPIVFTAASTSATSPTPNMRPEPIVGCAELVKFEFDFQDEKDARRDPYVSALIDGMDKPEQRQPNKADPLVPEQIARTRSNTLKKCFPVTLHRIETTPSLAALKNTLIGQGISGWQVDQAICNLQISEACHKYLLEELEREEADAPLAVLTARFEDVLSPLREITSAELEGQLLADAQYLIERFDANIRPEQTLFGCAGQLAHLGILHG